MWFFGVCCVCVNFILKIFNFIAKKIKCFFKTKENEISLPHWLICFSIFSHNTLLKHFFLSNVVYCFECVLVLGFCFFFFFLQKYLFAFFGDKETEKNEIYSKSYKKWKRLEYFWGIKQKIKASIENKKWNKKFCFLKSKTLATEINLKKK